MASDRRRTQHERRQTRRVPAIFAVRGLAGPVIELGQAEDITEGGMTLRWRREVAFGPKTPVSLNFELPGTHRCIAASALVTHDRELGRFRRTGVRFTGLDAEAADLIERYCRNRALRA